MDKIAAVRGVNFCADFSATPFYIKGSGYEEGAPFPWVVSDFGLVDAIESGIVKIPRVPVDDNTGELIPRYFRLWEYINQWLPASERQTARRRAKPESVLREGEGDPPGKNIRCVRRWAPPKATSAMWCSMRPNGSTAWRIS